MEYVPGIKINRIQALDQLGVDRKRSAQSYAIQFVEICKFTHILQFCPCTGAVTVSEIHVASQEVRKNWMCFVNSFLYL